MVNLMARRDKPLRYQRTPQRNVRQWPSATLAHDATVVCSGEAPMTSPRRFPPPWQVEQIPGGFQSDRRFRPSPGLRERVEHGLEERS
jgi:hypothetical protein